MPATAGYRIVPLPDRTRRHRHSDERFANGRASPGGTPGQINRLETRDPADSDPPVTVHG
eukprot:767207-Hanusia_phi.AAC.1